MAVTTIKESKIDEAETIDPIHQDNASKQILNNLAVTSKLPGTYTTTEASGIVTASYNTEPDNSSRNKTPLKGFLRKATRFIERTTNINPTNEDGELLIGAISLKVR